MNTLERSDGGTIRYRDTGSGQPIIVIHGWGTSGAFFDAFAGRLSSRFRLVIPDLRGHGASSAFPEGAGFALLADDLDALVGELGLERAVLLGWSLGAMVAWDYLDRYGDARVAGLVTIDMVPRLLNDAGWRHGLREGADESVYQRSLAFMRDDWASFTGVFVPRVFAPDATAGQLAEARRLADGNDPGSMARLWVALVNQDQRGGLAAIRVPTLVVHGGRSQLYDAEASRWLADQIPGARLECLEQAGHAPHLEAPERFEALVDEFVASLPQPQAPPSQTQKTGASRT